MNIQGNSYLHQESLIQKMLGAQKKGKGVAKAQRNMQVGAQVPTDYVKYGEFSLRFTPSTLKFTPPDWSKLATKRERVMPDEEYLEKMRDFARKVFAEGGDHTAESQALYQGYASPVSPDRKAIYEEVMQKTGGYMPASSMFWDHQGNKTLSYEYDYGTYTAINTPEEFARARELAAAYLDEMSRLYDKYGEKAVGKMSLDKIKSDLAAEKTQATAPHLGTQVDYSA
jgi:hypothetical protein